MSARILFGGPLAERVRAEVAERVEALGRPVRLATVLVGDDPASRVYVEAKHRAAAQAGIETVDHRLEAGTTQADLERLVAELGGDESVDGILVQMPLPPGLDEGRVIEGIDPRKDVDGLHPENLGRLVLGEPRFVPCTPQGVVALLEHYGVEIGGRVAAVVGRSLLVGRPLALLLGQRGRDATVIQAHSRTADLAELTRRADILVVAAGRPGLVGAGHVRPGAVVVDVGVNRTEEGLVGDVDAEAVAEVAGGLTPVPGGVGPMTVAMLLRNTVLAAERRHHAN